MSKICYTEKNFSASTLALIEQANSIIEEYADQGYDLTLRQLYYQFVARDWLANTVQSYKRLGNIISDARRAGLIDWDRIVDRTRYVRSPSAWESPAEIVSACSEQFNIDWWKNQSYRPEVWIEKDALIGVLEVACEPWHVPYFSCRGYVSDSEIWGAAQRHKRVKREGQTPLVIHLGDHDPSGLDMSRDIGDRLELFAGFEIEVRRVALNMDQIEEYSPPPNPAKETDARFAGYQQVHGDESWELDALSPTTISDLIAAEMDGLIIKSKWRVSEIKRDRGREQLRSVANDWDRLVELAE